MCIACLKLIFIYSLIFLASTSFATDPIFANRINYSVWVKPEAVFSANLDGDGDFDLVTANYASDDISILKNNGDGTFAPMINYDVGNNPYEVILIDFDNDDDFDLAVVNDVTNDISILKNDGDGTFESAVFFSVGGRPRSIFSADLDGDGDIDIEMTQKALDTEGIDVIGLDDLDRKFLRVIVDYYKGGPVGIEAIAATLNEEVDTLVDMVEPYLLKIDFLQRTKRGRMVSHDACKHLGIKISSSDQPNLFE